MARIEVKGSQVNVIEMNVGGGDPVIMIHGLLTSLATYYFETAPIVAHDHHVVLYDLRSHGMSDRRTEGYTLEILSQDLLDLMETLNISRANLVGYSYGGAISLYTALNHPDKVANLALIEAPTLKEKILHDFARGARQLLVNQLNNYTKSTGIAVTNSKAESTDNLYNFLTKDKLLLEAVRHDQFFTDVKQLEELITPTLLLYGTQSELLETGQMFASRIPQAELRLAEGDHNLPVQQASFLASELKGFLTPDKVDSDTT
jgi:pimeloyl-ACP methyl ester carboxylesterase